jgi:hypothetical protein
MIKAVDFGWRAAPVCLSVFLSVCGRGGLAQSSLEQRALRTYFDNKPDSAFLLFKAAVQERPRDAVLLAWLAETALRSRKASEGASAADEALRIDSCNAHAHLMRAYIFMPRFAASPSEVNDDSVWVHVTRAVECDSTDGNAWTYVWKYAVVRQDTAAESRALRALINSGFLTPSQLTYGEWVLRSLPPNAVLITAGDLDTYTPLAIQVARETRRDVAVINATMLTASWYAHPVLARHHLNYHWANAHVPASNESRQILEWLRQQAVGRGSARPIAFALTVNVDTTAAADGLQLAGPYWLVVPGKGATIDFSRVDMSLSSAENLDWQGKGISPSDRSPIHGLAERYPSLMVARLLELANGLQPHRNPDLERRQEAWLKQFLARAGIDSAIIDQTLEQLRGSRRSE